MDESQVEPGGNTEPPGKRRKIQGTQCYNWVFTLSQQHESQKIQPIELWNTLYEYCKKFKFQLEKGEGGLLHYQGSISLKTKDRLGPVKNMLGTNWIHLEETLNIFAANKYVGKAETRVDGPWDEKHMPLDPIIDAPLYDWQQKLLDEIRSKPDKRQIVWYHDKEGNKGKTSFAVHLSRIEEGVVRISGRMKRTDVCHIMSKQRGIKCVLFDIERDDFFSFDYGILAELKSGQIVSGKYDSGIFNFNVPWVVVFANHEPNKERMSFDRWVVRSL